MKIAYPTVRAVLAVCAAVLCSGGPPVQAQEEPAPSNPPTSAPTLPVASSFPSAIGNWPETNTWSPARTAGR